MNLSYLAGPFIGAIIGYCTNYIAVKMLFYPRKEIRIFGHKLPFTPGAIPKGQPRLAKAVGEVVGKTLLTKADMVEKLNGADLGGYLADLVVEQMKKTPESMAVDMIGFPQEDYEEKKEAIAGYVADEMVSSMANIDLAGIITDKGSVIIKEKMAGTMIGMFLNDDLLASVLGPIGTEFANMIQYDGRNYLEPVILQRLNEMDKEPMLDVCKGMGVTETGIRGLVISLVFRSIEPSLDMIVEKLDISGIVNEKISSMSVDELEDLVWMVMKKELNTIVNLGAIIGLILGTLNIFLR